MTRNEIENKVKLEIINVNKIIANKRRETKSKEKIYRRANMNFCIASMQIRERKRRKRKKRKVILSQTMLDHITYVTHRGMRHRDEGNDVVKLRLQLLKSVVDVA
jgi:hypothetical protein